MSTEQSRVSSPAHATTPSSNINAPIDGTSVLAPNLSPFFGFEDEQQMWFYK
jgi:hypothetical protein